MGIYDGPLYLSGPMSGMPDFNYPAFNRAAAKLRALGWEVLNPAENFAGCTDHPEGRKAYMRADINSLLLAKGIVLLEDWERSRGARLEAAIARELELPVFTYDESTTLPLKRESDLFVACHNPLHGIVPGEESWVAPRTSAKTYTAGIDLAHGSDYSSNLTFEAEKPKESILEEANRLVNGDRQESYGHPLDDFSRTARMWSAVLSHDVTAEQVGLCMACVKISRQVNRPGRDNLVDLAGYAQTVQMVTEERQKRNAASN